MFEDNLDCAKGAFVAVSLNCSVLKFSVLGEELMSELVSPKSRLLTKSLQEGLLFGPDWTVATANFSSGVA